MNTIATQVSFSPVNWCCRIHRLDLCGGISPPPKECPVYDTKQLDGEASVMLELWGMLSAHSLLSHPCSLWPAVVAPERVLFMVNKNCLISELSANK